MPVCAHEPIAHENRDVTTSERPFRRACWCLQLLLSNSSPPPRTSPVNSREVFLLSMPDVPSNTCTTARVPSTSSTWPRRRVPSPSLISTISAYFGFCSHRMHRGRGCKFVQSISFATQRCWTWESAACNLQGSHREDIHRTTPSTSPSQAHASHRHSPSPSPPPPEDRRHQQPCGTLCHAHGVGQARMGRCTETIAPFPRSRCMLRVARTNVGLADVVTLRCTDCGLEREVIAELGHRSSHGGFPGF